LHKGRFLDERETVEIEFAANAEAAVEMAFRRADDTTRVAKADRP